MISNAFETIIIFICRIIFEIIFFYTGEIVLYVISLGKKKPRWNYYSDEENLSLFMIFTELSEWVGIVFWILVIVLVRLIFKS